MSVYAESKAFALNQELKALLSRFSEYTIEIMKTCATLNDLGVNQCERRYYSNFVRFNTRMLRNVVLQSSIDTGTLKMERVCSMIQYLQDELEATGQCSQRLGNDMLEMELADEVVALVRQGIELISKPVKMVWQSVRAADFIEHLISAMEWADQNEMCYPACLSKEDGVHIKEDFRRLMKICPEMQVSMRVCVVPEYSDQFVKFMKLMKTIKTKLNIHAADRLVEHASTTAIQFPGICPYCQEDCHVDDEVYIRTCWGNKRLKRLQNQAALKCGHPMHTKCLSLHLHHLVGSSLQCPTCREVSTL